MRSDSGFTSFRGGTMRPAARRRASYSAALDRREWNGVRDNEVPSLRGDVWSKHFSRVLFRLRCHLLGRCPQAKHQVQERVKTSNRSKDVDGEHSDTGSSQTDTMLWKRWRYTLSVSAVAIGSVMGSLLAQGPGYLSSAERGVVTVIYGCCNPCSESPDVYPTPYFLLLKEPWPGILNLRRD